MKNGKVDISVTTFVPAPKEVVTEVKPTEVVEAVKSIPLAAAQFQPTGLQFSEPVNISIPNPIPGVTFPKATMQLSYLNPDNGDGKYRLLKLQWVRLIIKLLLHTSLLML